MLSKIGADKTPEKKKDRWDRYRRSQCCGELCIRQEVRVWRWGEPSLDIGRVSLCGACYGVAAPLKLYSDAPRDFDTALCETMVRCRVYHCTRGKDGKLVMLDLTNGKASLVPMPATAAPEPARKPENAYQPEPDQGWNYEAGADAF